MNREQLTARLLATFVGELVEQARQMNEDLLGLEREPQDRERLKALFRVAHTLRGAARASGIALVEQTCQVLEGMLVDARDGRGTLGPPEFALLHQAADALHDAGQRLGNGTSLEGSPLAQLRQYGALGPRPRGGC